ncbi:hypothetical protein L6164_022849 [Bauhinia variegata]|uniref:Uncharacterized protein n=1 Tax=Bauhinia variegata TaxID=167791 RepID=A0ACB9MGU8_BAUVA|nr:hypothetical protein L6164_022849 [Bauhinia variegata]
MVRGKVKLRLIADESARRAAFRKRTKGLLKKLDEVTKLCDVEACAIIYGQNEAQPTLWPSPEGFQAVIHRFMGMSEVDRSKKMLNLESYLQERLIKTHEQINRLSSENEEKRLTLIMYEYLAAQRFVEKPMDLVDLDGLIRLLHQNMGNIARRMAMLNATGTQGEASSSHPPNQSG